MIVEKRHADQLQKKNLDKESRLEVIYRVLKDQLRRAKGDLLEMKRDKESHRLAAIAVKKRIDAAQERASQRDQKLNLKTKVKQRDHPNQDGIPIYDLDKTVKLAPELQNIVKHLLHTEVRAHNRYCPCCKNYDEGNDLSA